ncbi:MAG: SRPBCC family protein [Planctomycetes bacterium]|nr:SRPBCC family protein [Planctomycetota bacterium]
MTGPAGAGGPERRVAVEREIGAAPAAAFDLLADYREGHPSILPRPWIRGLTVVEGGRGAGTVLDVRLWEWGRTRTLRMRVSEPVPGRVLEEVDPAGGVRTTFTVSPLPDPARCRVAIATVWPHRPGLAGRLEWLLLRAAAPGIYRKELDLMARRLEAGRR